MKYIEVTNNERKIIMAALSAYRVAIRQELAAEGIGVKRTADLMLKIQEINSAKHAVAAAAY